MAGALRDRAGGIGGLYRLLREHGRAIEADLRRYYQVRLRHLFTGDITHRELLSLIRHLPLDSALGRALYGESADWDPALHRLTDIADLLIVANWQRAEQTTRPDLITRPGATAPAKAEKVLTPAEFDALFDD